MIQQCQLVWIDHKINNSENKRYQEELKQLFDKYNFFENNHDAVKYFHQQKNVENIVVIVSSSFVYSKTDLLGYNQIYFCGNSKLHIQKFLEDKELVIMIDSGIKELERFVQINKEFLIAKELLNMQFDKQITENVQYYHQFEEISFRFLLINQKLKQNEQCLEEQLLESEIIQLTSQQELNKIKIAVKLVEKNYNKKFTIFEKLIYYYTTDQLGYKMNENMAQSNYESLKQIMLTLFKGYSELNQQDIPKQLYRGICFEDSKKDIYENILNDLQKSQTYRKNLYWNTLSSTSSDFQQARNFASRQKFGILFEIQLQDKNPHPFFKLEPYHSKFSFEKEILLFPQFQFIVDSIQQMGGIQYVIIKQVPNNFAMAFNSNQREQYWMKRVQNELKPKLKIINQFQQLRINYLIQNIKNIPDDQGDIKVLLKQNLDLYFQTLVQFLEKLYKNYVPHQEYLSQLLQVLFNDIQICFLLSEDFLEKFKFFIKSTSELIIEQFINIIQELFDLQDFKSRLTNQWNIQFENQNFILQDYNFQKISINQPIYTSASLNWRQLQMQEVMKLQIVKHSFSGRIAYEATLQDGNKILLHDINSKPGDLTFVKKHELGSTNTGYSDNWQPQGEPLNTENLTIKDIQTSVKGKMENNKFNLKNFNDNKTAFNQKQQFVQVGGAIGSMMGATIVDAFYGKVDGLSLVKNTFLGGSMLWLNSAVPVLGLIIQGGLGLLQVHQILSNESFSQKDKAQQIGKLVVQAGTNVAATFQSIQSGAYVGGLFGPVGAVVGAVIGGIVGGAAGKLFHNCVENLAKFKIKVNFNNDNKAQSRNGFLIIPGVNPRIQFFSVGDKVQSLIVLAITNKGRIAWIAVNISPNINEIGQNNKLGIISIKYHYIGPLEDESSVIFHAFGVQDQNVNEKTVIDDIQNKRLKFVNYAMKKIKI